MHKITDDVHRDFSNYIFVKLKKQTIKIIDIKSRSRVSIYYHQ